MDVVWNVRTMTEKFKGGCARTGILFIIVSGQRLWRGFIAWQGLDGEAGEAWESAFGGGDGGTGGPALAQRHPKR